MSHLTTSIIREEHAALSAMLRSILLLLALCAGGFTLERPGVEYKIFQFPADKIPRIDGDPSDWSIVPETLKPTRSA